LGKKALHLSTYPKTPQKISKTLNYWSFPNKNSRKAQTTGLIALHHEVAVQQAAPLQPLAAGMF
jgi:hypothetical protein